METCRLCLNNEQLVWVFDQRIICPNNIKDVIRITTGVEITQNDVISQKICAKCCQVTIKMFQFRTTALKNDLELKRQYEQFQKSRKENNLRPLTPVQNYKKKAIGSRPPTPSADFIKTSDLFLVTDSNNIVTETILIPAITPPKRSTTPKPVQKASNHLHFSVKDLFKIYPSVRIPATCLNKHLSPIITLNRDDVDAYFKEKERSKSLFETALPNCIKITKVDSINSSENRKRKLNDLESDKLDLKYHSVDKISKLESETVIDDNSKTIVQECTMEPMCVDKSVQILVCEICNSVLYNSRDLHNHKKKHLKCQFCKKLFKTLDQKYTHLHNLCDIKNMMSNLPIVSLTRLEKVFEKYENSSRMQLCAGGTETVKQIAKKSTGPNRNTAPCDEEIYCISDDSDIELIDDSMNNEQSGSTLKKSTESTYNEEEVSNIDIVDLIKDDIAASKGPSSHGHMLTPIINYKNNCILNLIKSDGSDINSIELILKWMKTAHLKKINELSVQTDLPTFRELHVIREQRFCEFRKFNHSLNYYRIPVNISRGEFDAKIEYNYANKGLRRREISKWHVLKKIDIQTPKYAANRQNSTKSTYTLSSKTDSTNCNSTDIVQIPNNSFKELELFGNKKKTSSSNEVNELTYSTCDLTNNFCQVLPKPSSLSTQSSLNLSNTALANVSNKTIVTESNQINQSSIQHISNIAVPSLPTESLSAYTSNIITSIKNTTSYSCTNSTNAITTTPITQISQSVSVSTPSTTIHHFQNIYKPTNTIATELTKSVSTSSTNVALNPVQTSPINYSLSNPSNSSHCFIYGISTVTQHISQTTHNAINSIKIIPNCTKTSQIYTTPAVALPQINHFTELSSSVQPGNSLISAVTSSVTRSNQTGDTSQITYSNTWSEFIPPTKILPKQFCLPSSSFYQNTTRPEYLSTALIENVSNRIQTPTSNIALWNVQKLSESTSSDKVFNSLTSNENSIVSDSKKTIHSKENKTAPTSEQIQIDASKFINSTEYNVFLEDMPALCETPVEEPAFAPSIRVKNVWELK